MGEELGEQETEPKGPTRRKSMEGRTNGTVEPTGEAAVLTSGIERSTPGPAGLITQGAGVHPTLVGMERAVNGGVAVVRARSRRKVANVEMGGMAVGVVELTMMGTRGLVRLTRIAIVVVIVADTE